MSSFNCKEELINVICDLLYEKQSEMVYEKILFRDSEFLSTLKETNALLKELPNGLSNEIFLAFASEISLSEKALYRQGFQDGINLALDMLGKERV